jgi:hypothetical protein
LQSYSSISAIIMARKGSRDTQGQDLAASKIQFLHQCSEAYQHLVGSAH